MYINLRIKTFICVEKEKRNTALAVGDTKTRDVLLITVGVALDDKRRCERTNFAGRKEKKKNPHRFSKP